MGIARFPAGAGMPERLDCVLRVAESIRRLHDAGQIHGGLSFATVPIAGGGSAVETRLAPPLPEIGPGSAPEVLRGAHPDVRSDIFSFGRLLREVFPGATPEIDRVISNCLAQDPTRRYQRIQQVICELRLLVIVERLRRPDYVHTLAARIERLEEAARSRSEAPTACARAAYWFPGRSGRGWQPGHGSALAARHGASRS